MKTIIITGGSGFIGSNLCLRLINEGHNVICIDNLSSGKLENIADLIDNKYFTFINADISKPFNFNLPNHVDEIYHLACPASPPKYQKNPMKTIKTCLNGTMNVLKLCKKYKCKMLFSSTSEIYGDPLVHPQPESYYGNVNTIGPRSCYDESKRMCETIIYEYRNKHNLDLKIIRIFNTYGPKMDLNDGRVMTNFIKSIKDSNPVLQIVGDGNQTRSFCYIDDLLDGLSKMMLSNELGPINLGNPDYEFTINELADIFDQIYGKKFKRMYLPKTMNDPQQRKPDITKAKELLNWYPKMSIYDGINIMIKFYEN